MSSANSVGYRLLRRFTHEVERIETRLIARKSPAEILAHFKVRLPVHVLDTKVCPSCGGDTVAFVRALQSDHCMSCHWPQYREVGQSAPPWDPNAPVVPAKVPDSLAVEVAEPVPGIVMPLREGEQMRAVPVEIQSDVNGQIGG